MYHLSRPLYVHTALKVLYVFDREIAQYNQLVAVQAEIHSCNEASEKTLLLFIDYFQRL